MESTGSNKQNLFDRWSIFKHQPFLALVQMFDVVIIFVIFLGLRIRKLFVRSDEFSIDNNLFDKLVKNVIGILGHNMRTYTRTGSTACGISIGSSDIDIGIYVKAPIKAVFKLMDNGYIITSQYEHFINLTKKNNSVTNYLDTDVKIYFLKTEIERLRYVCKFNARNVPLSERYWLISQKIWYNLSGQFDKYDSVKIAYYKKHGIIK
jgi:hypothetical protein